MNLSIYLGEGTLGNGEILECAVHSQPFGQCSSTFPVEFVAREFEGLE